MATAVNRHDAQFERALMQAAQHARDRFLGFQEAPVPLADIVEDSPKFAAQPGRQMLGKSTRPREQGARADAADQVAQRRRGDSQFADVVKKTIDDFAAYSEQVRGNAAHA